MIREVRFSNSIKFFEKGFCERWNISSYHNMTDPCLFAGVYGQEDVDYINKHKGFKVVWMTGRIRPVFFKINPVDVIVIVSDIFDWSLLKNKYKTKKVNFAIKDYSMFTPNKLGDKIYCYLGSQGMKHEMGFAFIEKVKTLTKFEILYGFQGHSISYVKENYYDNCFVNIKPNLTGGFTTAIELAYMGRQTISNSDAPFCLGYVNYGDVIRLINKESEKIGTIQPSLMDGFFNVGDEWKNINYWL